MTRDPPDIDIRPVKNFEDIAPLWLDLERRAAGSFFQSWAWTGCLADERFNDARLLTARRGGEVVGLALFNRASGGRIPGVSRSRLLLGESGTPSLDTIFVEHNGLLLDRTADDGLAGRCWQALAESSEGGLGGARWILSGMAEAASRALPRVMAGRRG